MANQKFKLLGYGKDFIVPLIAYQHNAGAELYKEGETSEHFMNTMSRNPNRFRNFDYTILILWGDINKQEKVIDVFGFSGIKDWPGNPDVSALTFRNGVYTPSHEITCGDTLILLGREEENRRKTKSLDDYLVLH